MRTSFTIGGGGGKKARGLPNGTLVCIADVGLKKSGFKRVVQKDDPRRGLKAGDKVDNYQLLVVYEAREPGRTKPFKTQKGLVPAEDFNEGDRFDQYLGGVYLHDDGNEENGIEISPAGGAFAFVEAMETLGVPKTGEFETYVGAEVRIEQVVTSGPAGRSSRAEPAELVTPPTGRVDAKADAIKKTAANLAAKAEAARKKERASGASAFDTLSDADKEAVQDALDAGLDSPEDLVNMGFADTKEEAEAILATAPRDTPPKKPAKKAAKKPVKKAHPKKGKGSK